MERSHSHHSAPTTSRRRANVHGPVNTLAAEILSIIFEEAYFSNAFARLSRPRYASTLGLRPELTVSQVNRRWRSVALNTPLLWSGISIDGSPSTFELTAIYLNRSDEHVLDVCLAEPRSIDDFKTHLIPYAHRWRSLYVINRDREFWREFVDTVAKMEVPEMRHLQLDSAGDILDTLQLQSVFGGGTPSLLRLSIFGSTISVIATTFSTLRTLHLHNTDGTESPLLMDCVEFIAMLNNHPSLQNLIIHGDIFFRRTHNPDPLVLPALTYLEYTSKNASVDLARVLVLLVAPQLRRLLIRASIDDDFEDVSDGRFPSITSLVFSLSHDPISIETWKHSTRIMPNINELTLSSTEFSRFSEMTSEVIVGGGGLVWPQLRTIAVIPPDPTLSLHSQDVDKLIDCVKLREQRGCPVTLIKFSRSILSLHMEELKALEVVTAVSQWDIEATLQPWDSCEWYDLDEDLRPF